MTVNLITVADEVVSALDASDWNPDLPAERAYAVTLGISELKTLKAWVIPTGEETVRGARGFREVKSSVQIMIAKRVENRSKETIDPLESLVCGVARLFENMTLPVSGLVENGIAITPFDYEKLRNEGVFAALVELVFEGIR